MNAPRTPMTAALIALAAFGPTAALAGDERATSPTVHEADVCVYGGTSGGVVAAVQAARLKRSVVLVEPGRHLGGMTSGGLSAVDIGDPRSVGGIAREYFTRLVASYGKTLNWDQPFRDGGGPATGGAYSIEPHVAEALFDTMVEEAGVTVLREARLESVRRENGRIRELRTDDGRLVRARVFVDGTYEGDLMAAAGVSWTVTREGNAKYGERYNGIHYARKYEPRPKHDRPGANGRVPGGQGVWDRDFPLDPYVVPGDPRSGLLPLVDDGEPGVPGEPAAGIQAYCYRLCLTTDEENGRPIAPPEDYDPRRYELVARFIAACRANGDDMDLRWFGKHDPLPNEKWDFNTATFGGNLPRANWNWPKASYEQRTEIAREIENYHRGLLHFLATDPRVPDKVRTQTKRFHLPKDEFLDTGGWPHQLYIREGRRMVSDFVMTEHHTFGREIAPKSIGLGSYGTDSHEVRRIVRNGVVTREGKLATGRGGFGPYRIGYGAIVPKRAECENLLVPFALSASHSAFASIRMEPVFMVTSQSAATAASLAIDAGVAVQDVDYERLRERLLADGQVLEWGQVTRVPSPRKSPKDLPGIVLDDSAATFEGTWTESDASGPVIGSSYRHDGNRGRGEKSATFSPKVPEAADYEVRLIYTADNNRSSRTMVTVESVDGKKTFRLDQRKSPLVEDVPRALGTFRFTPEGPAKVTVSNEMADGYVVVDGLQLLFAAWAREERAGRRKSGFESASTGSTAPAGVLRITRSPDTLNVQQAVESSTEDERFDPARAAKSPLLNLPDVGTDAINFDRLPELPSEHAVIADVRDRGGRWVHQHGYLAHHDGRYWAMWSDRPGVPKVSPERHRDVVPGHDRAGTRVSFATSPDGVTWSRPADLSGPPRHEGFGWIARGFWQRDGKLLALASHFRAPGYPGRGLSLEAFRLDEAKKGWVALGTVRDDTLNNFPPKRLPDGRWMTTRRDHQRRVSVLIGGAERFDDWEVRELASYDEKGRPEEPYWYTLPDDRTLVGLIRDNGGSKRLLRTFSTDGGHTWSPIHRTNFPDATSEFFALRTSRGYYMLVSNANPRGRDPLTLAVSRDGLTYDRLFRLVGGRHVDYPHVIERNGRLLVSFSGAKQTMEVLRIELDDLDELLDPDQLRDPS